MDTQQIFSPIKIAFMSMLFIVITACSLKTIYNQLDALIPSYVEGLVSLDDALENKVEQRTEILINWHRTTQLKQYADWLSALQRDINDELTTGKLEQHLTILETFWHSIVLKMNEEMIILLPLLTGDQRQQLFESIDEKNDKYREDYIDVSEDERIEKYSEHMVDTYKNWLGELTDDQVYLIEKAAAELKSSARLRLQQRLLWQHNIGTIINTTDSTVEKFKRLHVFFDGYEMNNNSLKAIKMFNSKILVQLTLQIVHGSNRKQKDYFMNETNDYIRMFTELSENR
jgi:hypothetical protein